MTRLDLVLVDDWELRGDGGGDPRVLQFATLRRLLDLYERLGLRASVNAEVMQQLHHRAFAPVDPELGAIADEWDALVLEAYRRGHDVQLHVHAQWEGARFEDGRWVLTGDWAITKHPPETARSLIRRARTYLEELIRRVDPSYRCVSFRSGQWCLAPSEHMLSILADEGFVFDMSIVAGAFADNEKLSFDYRDCEEGFLPFYPDMRDARRLAKERTPIVCVPTFSFHETLGHKARTLLRRYLRPGTLPKAPNETPMPRGPRDKGRAQAYGVWGPGPVPPLAERIRRLVSPQHFIADLSALNRAQLRDMMKVMRRKARRSGRAAVPVILENHTKDLGDFTPLEDFATELAKQPDVKVVTLREVARGLQGGVYEPILRENFS